jgi:SAM-dependent methyltransferase
MSVDDLVSGHYGSDDLSAAILAAVADHGVDVDRLTASDLAPVDQLHAGGPGATMQVLERLGLADGARLLDVGSGLGGPSRLAASTLPITVAGADLTPQFVETARILTQRVGLAERVSFELASGASMPFDDRTFDAAMMIHVGMNVADKRAVFADVHRVLRPEGTLVVFDQMRVGPGDLPYPLPWATDQRSSFAEPPSEYAGHPTAAGFTVETTEDRTPAAEPAPGVPGALGPQVVFGEEFVRRIGNNMAATADGMLAAVLIVARA